MKKKQLIADQLLQLFARLGISQEQYAWKPRQCEMYVVVGGKLRTLKIRASMTRMEIGEVMGRVGGWCEALAQ